MAKSERKTNFIGGIIWLLVASCVVTLSLRLGYDVLGKQPVGNLTSWLYDISNTLLLPLSWIENYIELSVS